MGAYLDRATRQALRQNARYPMHTRTKMPEPPLPRASLAHAGPGRRPRVLAGLALLLPALLLTGCLGQSRQSTSSPTSDTLQVVASTNVYGSIAQAVGKDEVSVRSLITSSSQDPHSYEATAQDKLAVSRAALLIRNGGGYDDFLDKLSDGADPASVIDVAELSGLSEPGRKGHEINEHFWYSLPTVTKLAETIAGKLAAQRPEAAARFQQNAQAFTESIRGLEKELAGIKATQGGAPVAITEPVPLYLLEQAGLVNRTPEELSHAVEDGSDVPPLVLRNAIAQLSARQVRLLAYNRQTESVQTEQLKRAAQDAEVPVVDFAETLPQGQDYLEWMRDNVQRLAAALR